LENPDENWTPFLIGRRPSRLIVWHFGPRLLDILENQKPIRHRTPGCRALAANKALGQSSGRRQGAADKSPP